MKNKDAIDNDILDEVLHDLGTPNPAVRKQWCRDLISQYTRKALQAESVDVEDWLKTKPSDDYKLLRRQFSALKNICNAQAQQISIYDKKTWELGEKRLSALQESLDSEKEMNAILTEELEKRTTPEPQGKFKRGDYVRKKGNKGQWHGIICGEYDNLDQQGYCVRSVYEENSVQIYPESALEFWILLKRGDA